MEILGKRESPCRIAGDLGSELLIWLHSQAHLSLFSFIDPNTRHSQPSLIFPNLHSMQIKFLLNIQRCKERWLKPQKIIVVFQSCSLLLSPFQWILLPNEVLGHISAPQSQLRCPSPPHSCILLTEEQSGAKLTPGPLGVPRSPPLQWEVCLKEGQPLLKCSFIIST